MFSLNVHHRSTKAKIVLNTMVTTFSAYCKSKFEVEPVEVIYPDGKSYFYPDLSFYDMEVPLSYITGLVGVSLKTEEILMNNKSAEFDELDKVLEHAFDMDNDDEEEDNDDKEDDDGDEEENDNEGEEDEGKHPLKSDEVDVSGVQLYEQFNHLEYQALADKKRKALSDTNLEEPGKRARQDNISGASFDEIMEAMNYGIRRKSHQSKKRGRRKGSKNKHSPEITRMLGDAVVHHVHGRYEESISVLKEVVRLAPQVHEAYHTLGLVHKALGNTGKAMGFYAIAARLKPKDSSLWRVLYTWHLEQGDLARASMCLSKAIRADPNDIDLRYSHASLYIELGDYQRAAELFDQIVKICPQDGKALKAAAELYFHTGQIERGLNILEDYIKDHPMEVDLTVLDLQASLFMEINAYNNALQHIEHACLVFYSGEELPLQLKIKAGICHIHLGNLEKAEILLGGLQLEAVSSYSDLITEVADAYMSLKCCHSALKYYHMLKPHVGDKKVGYIQSRIAECYLSLEEREKAIMFFYKALDGLEDSVGTRLTLASMMLEDAKEEEAISLLSPPENLGPVDSGCENQKPWWLDGKIKLKLCYIYRAKGMLEDFVNTTFPLVRESLFVKTIRPKVKKRLTLSVLRKRTKILDIGDGVDVFGGVRPLASRSDLSKAARARKLLQKKEEQKAAAKAAGIDFHSDESDDDCWQEVIRLPPLPNFLENEEHHVLIIDLCKALQSLRKYWEALEIISLTRRLANDKLPAEKLDELQSLVNQISYNITDPKYGFDCVRSIVVQHPYSFSAWNCYYRIMSRLGKSYSKHAKFLRYMRAKHSESAPPLVISGHQFTMGSHHQDAAREYLEAYKLLPESPLINLCVGTALINLALGFRLQNKHQCVAQGLAFLYNNLRLTANSQEALYNIARAYHHVGLVSMAVSYYQKVLATCEKDYPVPKLLDESTNPTENLKPGYCDLRKEAAHNLHLIYKKSGALDLARQVLKDHCSF
ncbi:hypothetical protein K2173_006937 [Erythroxylum novogranatense]|uniref:General transcription factor 3C polypeptide 3 n=1 Tax=Erythroxylum novogranatense TaxID=1862640 RepID=A0AAV8SY61_9ROSI|nr:hypothetical protein K2173_006937 [Erythroxylum novogranatense]